jgi:hypothetical protein
MTDTEKRNLGLVALLLLLVWRSGGQERPFEQVFSELPGLTGTTYATNRGVFFLTNENHEMGPGLWYEISEEGEFVGPIMA